MTDKKKILAVSGSTRQLSTNLNLLQAIIEMYQDKLDIEIFQKLSNLPHFNPDLDTDNPPEAVARFRQELTNADGVLICTPEYAMGVPGTLKNAIDWTVSSMEFSHKPVALITASSAGQKGHSSLWDTLKVIEATIPDSSQLLISFVQTKVKDKQITDPDTREQVKKLIESLMQTINDKTVDNK